MNDDTPTIAELVEHLAGTELPLLFVDTCALLDIIRVPVRQPNALETIAGALRIVEQRKNFNLVISSVVIPEFQANLPTVISDLDAKCHALREEITLFNDILALVGLETHSRISFDSYDRLASELTQLSQTLLGTALTFQRDHHIELKAFRRSSARIPPGHRGGQDKDCLLFEELLEVARQLRSRDHCAKVVFCTSNTKDYCEFRSRPHPEIVRQLDPLQIDFTTNLPWACAELGF